MPVSGEWPSRLGPRHCGQSPGAAWIVPPVPVKTFAPVSAAGVVAAAIVSTSTVARAIIEEYRVTGCLLKYRARRVSVPAALQLGRRRTSGAVGAGTTAPEPVCILTPRQGRPLRSLCDQGLTFPAASSSMSVGPEAACEIPAYCPEIPRRNRHLCGHHGRILVRCCRCGHVLPRLGEGRLSPGFGRGPPPDGTRVRRADCVGGVLHRANGLVGDAGRIIPLRYRLGLDIFAGLSFSLLLCIVLLKPIALVVISPISAASLCLGDLLMETYVGCVDPEAVRRHRTFPPGDAV